MHVEYHFAIQIIISMGCGGVLSRADVWLTSLNSCLFVNKSRLPNAYERNLIIIRSLKKRFVFIRCSTHSSSATVSNVKSWISLVMMTKTLRLVMILPGTVRCTGHSNSLCDWAHSSRLSSGIFRLVVFSLHVEYLFSFLIHCVDGHWRATHQSIP